MSTKTTRRKFLKTAAVAAIGMPTIIPASALGRDGNVAPSNRLVLGGIGLLRTRKGSERDRSIGETVAAGWDNREIHIARRALLGCGSLSATI